LPGEAVQTPPTTYFQSTWLWGVAGARPGPQAGDPTLGNQAPPQSHLAIPGKCVYANQLGTEGFGLFRGRLLTIQVYKGAAQLGMLQRHDATEAPEAGLGETGDSIGGANRLGLPTDEPKGGRIATAAS
jgi:hypothetical protein